MSMEVWITALLKLAQQVTIFPIFLQVLINFVEEFRHVPHALLNCILIVCFQFHKNTNLLECESEQFPS